MMRTARLQLRFLLPLVVTMLAAAYVALPLMDEMTLRWFGRDLNARGVLVANALSDSVAEALVANEPAKLKRLFTRTAQDERLFAIGVCDADGNIVQQTTAFPNTLSCADALALAGTTEPRLLLSGGPLHVSTHAVTGEVEVVPEPSQRVGTEATLFGEASGSFEVGPPSPASTPIFKEIGVGHLVLLHDLSFIGRRSQDTRRYLIGFLAVLGLVIALITMLVAQLSWRGWVSGVRAIMRGEALGNPLLPPPELAPFVDELKTRLRDLEDEYRRSQGPEVAWTADRLRSLLHTQLRGDQVIVVSNREPYIHDRGPDGVVVRQPASGLVTAVEPVMRACSGTWIAHGSGSADRESVDQHDRVAVPPGSNDYWLRRIWLSADEERGYYYGFANEGMWPLCHVAHVRPVFRQSDWDAYRAINQRFADAVVAEARSDDPIVLVQDYHFALLPAMICIDGLRALDGVWLETKAGPCFALHYRAAPEHEAAVRQLAQRVADESNGQLHVQGGNCVAELIPPGRDKGTALRAFMEQAPFQGRRPIVIGDDLTDEKAFAEALHHDGFGVLVGTRRPTAALHALPSPHATLAWLETLARSLNSEGVIE